MAAVGLHCRMQMFPSLMHDLLIAVASLVVEHAGFSNYGTQA